MKFDLRKILAAMLAAQVLGPSIVPAAPVGVPTGSFTLVQPMQQFRKLHTATLLTDGRVLVVGGQTANRLLGSTEIYDPATGVWTNTGPLNVERESHTATPLTSGLVLVAGGFQNISSAEEFDFTSGQWTLTGSMNTQRYQHTATLLPDGKVLVTGGLNATDFLSSAELYDPNTRVWTPTACSLNRRAYGSG
jgi:hypothetical protein